MKSGPEGLAQSPGCYFKHARSLLGRHSGFSLIRLRAWDLRAPHLQCQSIGVGLFLRGSAPPARRSCRGQVGPRTVHPFQSGLGSGALDLVPSFLLAHAAGLCARLARGCVVERPACTDGHCPSREGKGVPFKCCGANDVVSEVGLFTHFHCNKQK